MGKKRGTEENLEEERENYCWYVCTERNSVEERGERKKEERSQEDWCGVLPYLEVTCACFIKTYARDFGFLVWSLHQLKNSVKNLESTRQIYPRKQHALGT